MLTAFYLTCHNNIGWYMGNTDCRRRFIYLLTAGTAGTININAQVIRINIHLNIIINFRHNLQ